MKCYPPLIKKYFLFFYLLLLAKLAHANFPQVHILMPVYKTEDYIEKSVQSVIDQTYATNTRLILLDDASPDESITKTKTLLNNQSQLQYTIITLPQNGGIGNARIELVNHSKEINPDAYILWLDSDDYYNDNKFIETFVKAMEESQADICLFSYNLEFSPHIPEIETLYETKSRERTEAVLRQIYNQDNHTASPTDIKNIHTFTARGWLKGYSGKFAIPEPARCKCEDFISVLALLQAEKITTLDPHYHPITYLKRENSLTGRRSAQSFFDLLTQLKKAMSSASPQLQDQVEAFITFKANQYRYILTELVDSPDRPDITQEILDNYDKEVEIMLGQPVILSQSEIYNVCDSYALIEN